MKFCSLLLVALVLVAVSQVQAQGHVKLADKNSPNLVDLEDQQGITGKPEPECDDNKPCEGWFYICSKFKTCDFDLFAPFWTIFD
nr:unnamed protein product [Callosobruchus analis]